MPFEERRPKVSKNLDSELPTILDQLAEAQKQLVGLYGSISKGRFLISQDQLQQLSMHMGIVFSYVQTSIKTGLNYEDEVKENEVPNAAKIGEKE